MGNSIKKMTRVNKYVILITIISYLCAIALAPWSSFGSNYQRWSYFFLIIVHSASYLFFTFKWTYCSLAEHDLRTIRYNEVWLLIIRWLHYFLAATIIGLSIFRGFQVSYQIVFPFSALLWLSFFHSLSRTTFRPLPCYLFSLIAIILFFCLGGLPYILPFANNDNAQTIYGLPNSADFAKSTVKYIVDLFNSNTATFKSVFATSALVVVLVPIALSVGRRLLVKYRSQATDSASNATRRQLLAHWWYNPKAVLIENAYLCVVIGFVVACVMEICFFLYIKESDCVRFFIFLSVIASGLTAIGSIWLFSIRDNDLMKSEYFFILYTALQIGQYRLGKDDHALNEMQQTSRTSKKNIFYLANTSSRKLFWRMIDKGKVSLNRNRVVAHFSRGMFGCVNQKKAHRRIHDFCQVATHLITNSSTIQSENDVVHQIESVFSDIGNVIRCEETHGILISELYNAYKETRATKNTDKSKQNQCDIIISNDQSTASAQIGHSAQSSVVTPEKCDLLFSSLYISMLCAPSAKTCPAIIGIISCVRTMREILETQEIRSCLINDILPTNELINLVLFGAIKHIAQMYSNEGCMVSSQCSRGCADCFLGTITAKNIPEATYSKRVSVLLYPIYVFYSIFERCPSLLQGKTRFKEKGIPGIIKKYYNMISRLECDSCPAKNQWLHLNSEANQQQIEEMVAYSIILYNLYFDRIQLLSNMINDTESIPAAIRSWATADLRIRVYYNGVVSNFKRRVVPPRIADKGFVLPEKWEDFFANTKHALDTMKTALETTTTFPIKSGLEQDIEKASESLEEVYNSLHMDEQLKKGAINIIEIVSGFGVPTQ